jgi:hypothetical protein
MNKHVLANLLRDAERPWNIFARPVLSLQMEPQMKVDVTEDGKVHHVKAAIHSMAKCYRGSSRQPPPAWTLFGRPRRSAWKKRKSACECLARNDALLRAHCLSREAVWRGGKRGASRHTSKTRSPVPGVSVIGATSGRRN